MALIIVLFLYHSKVFAVYLCLNFYTIVARAPTVDPAVNKAALVLAATPTTPALWHNANQPPATVVGV